MYEESIRFFTDLFQNDGSVLSILDADYTFLNEPLAKHYGIPGVTGAEWRRVDGVKKYCARRHPRPGDDAGQAIGRLAHQPDPARQLDQRSPARRKLAAAAEGRAAAARRRSRHARLTVRQLVEKHTQRSRSAPSAISGSTRSASALEGFDAIGRRRDKDLGDRPIDTRVKTMDGTEFDGLDGLRNYLLTKRRDAFLRQFCRKLLGYALGRAVQLSDEPLLDRNASQAGRRTTIRLTRPSRRSSAAGSSARFAAWKPRLTIDDAS